MLTVYNCVTAQHDLRFVMLAAAVCLLSSATAMGLLNRTQNAFGARRAAWLAITAAVLGVGIWATHFVAILGFKSGLPSSYEPFGTGASLLAAIVLLGIAIFTALQTQVRYAPVLGGALAGLAIGAMHYLGMASFLIEGHKLWDPGLVASSLAAGVVFAALSFGVAFRGKQLAQKVGGAVLLTLAICSLHFLGMSAVSILPDASVVAPPMAVSEDWLAVWVAGAALVLLIASATGLLVGHHQRRSEERRLLDLADAAIEGLAVFEDGLIHTVNASLTRMLGMPAAELVGKPLAALIDGQIPDFSDLHTGTRFDAQIKSAAGDAIPVELLVHELAFQGKQRLAVAIRDLRERVAAEAKIRFLAHHDDLTSLPNRLNFAERLELEIQHHRRKQDRFAVISFDLDNFKPVNDLLGHAAGDYVLKTVSNRIKAITREEDVVARLGGDEFGIICPGIDDPAQVAALCERMLAAAASPIEYEGQAAAIGLSIGISLYPHDGDASETLLRNADAALYQAKNEGRGAYRFFEAHLGVKLRERQTMEFDLRRALERGELSLLYQPQTSTRTNQIFGFEALLRWTCPTRGSVAPDVFIPLAEETGLIVPIGEWVLRQACAEAASWSKPLQIAVNVSGVQLRMTSLAERIQEILNESGLQPERLEIEITETALIDDFGKALRTLRQIKELGVKVAMDDFGTGYSSLSNLLAFPFNKIKIDQSFVRNVHGNEHGATIVRAIINVCQGLNLSVIAEGVETAEELQFLTEENCTQAQGYLMGRPANIEAFASAFAAKDLPVARLRQFA